MVMLFNVFGHFCQKFQQLLTAVSPDIYSYNSLSLPMDIFINHVNVDLPYYVLRIMFTQL